MAVFTILSIGFCIMGLCLTGLSLMMFSMMRDELREREWLSAAISAPLAFVCLIAGLALMSPAFLAAAYLATLPF